MKINQSIALVVALSLATTATFAAPPKPKRRGGSRPLTFTNTVAFFREALGRAPLKVDARTAVFAEGEWANRDVYSHAAILIENADEDLEITFMMSGDEGMNWVNEFFDSPFFERSETESLFQLLNNGPGTRRARVGRFAVELSRWEPRHHEIIVLSLTQRKR